MDNNKLAKLREIGYTIRKCCGNCVHKRLMELSGWGTCKVHRYKHRKHTRDDREVSIHMFGYCEKHEWSEGAMFQLLHYREFSEDRSE